MDQLIVTATTASAVVAGAWATGQPPDAVLLAALAGGVLSVWGDRPPPRITPGWVAAVLGRMALSVVIGLAGAAALPALAGRYEVVEPIGIVPQWVQALGCSLFTPSIMAILRGWFGRLAPPAVVPQERDQ